MVLEHGEILFNDRLSPDLYHVGLRCPEIASLIRPASSSWFGFEAEPTLSFAALRCAPAQPAGRLRDPLQGRRQGTRLLAETGRGTTLDILGPSAGASSFRGGRPRLLVAGGIGIAPLPFLAETVVGSGRKGPYLSGSAARPARISSVCATSRTSASSLSWSPRTGVWAGRASLPTIWRTGFPAAGQTELDLLLRTLPHATQDGAPRRSAGVPVQIAMEAFMACGVARVWGARSGAGLPKGARIPITPTSASTAPCSGRKRSSGSKGREPWRNRSISPCSSGLCG